MTTSRQVRAAVLGSCAIAALVTTAEARDIGRIEWIGSEPSTTAEQLSDMFTTAKVKVTYSDGTTEVRPLGYTMLMSTETRVGANANAAGVIYDVNMVPIPDPTGDGRPVTLETPDGTMLADIGGRIYHLSNYEYSWQLADGSESDKVMGPILPSSVTITELSQAADGTLSPVSQHPVDFSSVGGVAVTCNATVTPWGTFLTSEENYDADGRAVEADRVKDPSGMTDVLRGMTRYYNHGKLSSPYYRGVLPEIEVAADGSTSVVKHYAVGRGSYEMAQIMPDQRTVLGSHDGTNQPLTLFIADKAGDLSAGTLYAAKFDQKSAGNGGTFDLSWIRLGHATDDELKALVEGGIKFSDMFETAEVPAPGFTEITTGSDKHSEFLKVRNPTAAAFLEMKRYAGMVGAGTELRKSEGMAFDPATGTVYLAISEIGKGMDEGKGSGVGGDQIRVKAVKSGAVYALGTAGGQTDSDGNAIDSDFVPVSMHVPAGLMGHDMAEADALGNKAHPDAVANPDNLYWSAAYGTLFIGEDSGMHTSNVLWAWKPGIAAPVRLLNAPAGAELTGLRVIENLGGHAYATTNAQHVGDFKPGDNAVLKQAKAMIDDRWNHGRMAPLGYVTGLPAAPVPSN